jgi:pimeloyl-ACP methyl ester carboxylesterase
MVRGLNSDPDTARRAPDPQIPTLIAVGTDDPLHDRAQTWASELPAAEFISIPGRNHVSTVPSTIFRTAAAEFLGR